jgi:hypothetical protein
VQAPIRIPVWMFLNTAGHPQAGHGSVKTSASDGSGLYGSGWRAPLPGSRWASMDFPQPLSGGARSTVVTSYAGDARVGAQCLRTTSRVLNLTLPRGA